MTSQGGAGGGYGTIFQINADDGSGFKVLHSFNGASDGCAPQGSLLLSGSTLYGTTMQCGGVDGAGTIFSLTLTPAAPSGSLTVTISPAGAVSAGAVWQVDGGSWQQSGATVQNLAAGAHTVSFEAVTGWKTPAQQKITIANGKTATFVGTYVHKVGSLKVTITPKGAVKAGAQWQVDGGSWQQSGAKVQNLAAGAHTVSFEAVTGWKTPAQHKVTILKGQTTTATVTYKAVPQ